MKTRRLAASLALAAAVALGATGCGLIAPMGTTEPYAPSDGIDVDVNGLAIRNALLVADLSGENFNVVFAAVNTSEQPVLLRATFQSDSSEAAADFLVPPGNTLFGDPDADQNPEVDDSAAVTGPTLVTLSGVQAGSTVTGFFEVAGGTTVERQVPVLDGTLLEYEKYVLSPPVVELEGEAADVEVEED